MAGALKKDCDVFVAGGGIAGLIAALGFVANGFAVICADPGGQSVGSDKRTTAFLRPSKQLLEKIGVWQALQSTATPLKVMALAELSDTGGITNRKAFRADDMGAESFGWNIPNTAIKTALLNAASQSDLVEVLTHTSVKSFLARDAHIRVRLDDGTQTAAKLLVGADGRNSTVRTQAEIDTTTTRYGQKALVFTVTHSEPHNFTSTEIHRRGGPFTLVPLPDQNGTYRSSVVWMETGPNANRLAELDLSDFQAAVQERSGGILGALTVDAKPQIWPIISQHAVSLVAQRTALIAEAAHVVPPIGAQGLNMSLADIACLIEEASQEPNDPGQDRVLAAYQKNRLPDIRRRSAGIKALNNTSISGGLINRDLRSELLTLMHDIDPIRRGLMRLGLG